MSPATLVTLAALLVAVFLAVMAALLWQEAKRRGFEQGPIYVVEDAVGFIHDRLEGPDLRRSDVRRIIEYEVFYLQGLAQKDRRTAVEVVAGGAEPAVAYIAERISQAHGVAYPLGDIRAVLALETEYLASIGAVGDPVTDDSFGGDDR
jgi:hypothetical protein